MYYSVRDMEDRGLEIGGGMTPEAAIRNSGKWIEDNRLADALKYEGDTMGHCVGGYCPDVASGKSRIFSLRDAKNEPHVTIEVRPSKANQDDLLKQPKEIQDKFNNNFDNWRYGIDYRPSPEEIQHKAQSLFDELGIPLSHAIQQIKGKGNAKPKKDYIPYVQDFVKSGNWSDVGDLTNADLYHVHPESDVAKNLSAAGKQVPTYVTNDELNAISKRFRKARGGVVHKAKGGVEPMALYHGTKNPITKFRSR